MRAAGHWLFSRVKEINWHFVSEYVKLSRAIVLQKNYQNFAVCSEAFEKQLKQSTGQTHLLSGLSLFVLKL